MIKAILILGPTGAGKTPLGNLMGKRGLWGRRCRHFDFGANLRAIAGRKTLTAGLSAEDAGLIRHSVKTGALLEDKDFSVAEKILTAFLADKRIGGNDIVALNGLPRHVSQARNIGRILDVIMVVCLECSPETVAARIRLNTGGDREKRKDDSRAEVKKKLDIFRERTLPLVDYYRGKNVMIKKIRVTAETRPADIVRQIGKMSLAEGAERGG